MHMLGFLFPLGFSKRPRSLSLSLSVFLPLFFLFSLLFSFSFNFPGVGSFDDCAVVSLSSLGR